MPHAWSPRRKARPAPYPESGHAPFWKAQAHFNRDLVDFAWQAWAAG